MNAGDCPSEEELLAVVDQPEDSHAWSSHIKACPTCRAPLDEFCKTLIRVRQQSVSWLPTSAPAVPAATQPGPAAIGKYLVVGRLPGSAGFDSFRGLHPLLHTDLRIDVGCEPIPCAAEYREPIAAEVRRLISIQQPHLGRVRDSGYWNDRLFLVADYGTDERLDQRVLGAGLAPADAMSLVSTLAGVAGKLAEAGIAAAEIRPEGILIGESGPLWTDWGACWLLRAADRSAMSASLPQRIVCLLIDLLAPTSAGQHDPGSARMEIGRLQAAGTISSAQAKTLQAALDASESSPRALAQIQRGLAAQGGFWSRLLG